MPMAAMKAIEATKNMKAIKSMKEGMKNLKGQRWSHYAVDSHLAKARRATTAADVQHQLERALDSIRIVRGLHPDFPPFPK